MHDMHDKDVVIPSLNTIYIFVRDNITVKLKVKLNNVSSLRCSCEWEMKVKVIELTKIT